MTRRRVPDNVPKVGAGASPAFDVPEQFETIL